MGDDLTTDEFDALRQIAELGRQQSRPSACVARNVKRLTGLKYASYAKNGNLGLTDKGKQTLFIQGCIDSLRAVADNPQAMLKPDVATFLDKKGHIVALEPSGFEITQKGKECLADIDTRAK